MKTCTYCGIREDEYLWLRTEKDDPSHRGLTVDHIDPAGGDSAANLTPACGRCNQTKNHTFTYAEMKEIGKNYVKPVWKRIALKKIQILNENLLK